jgi:hypothetical protein
MTERVVNSPQDLELLKVYLTGRKLPFTVDITDGRDRSAEQNRLSQKWYGEISDQTGEGREDVRARCKLEIGVPIMRGAREKFRKAYDATIRPLPYDAKLEFIRDTDLPVTRLMNVSQMTAYMEEVFRRHAAAGIALTIPPDKYAFDPAPRSKAAA